MKVNFNKMYFEKKLETFESFDLSGILKFSAFSVQFSSVQFSSVQFSSVQFSSVQFVLSFFSLSGGLHCGRGSKPKCPFGPPGVAVREPQRSGVVIGIVRSEVGRCADVSTSCRRYHDVTLSRCTSHSSSSFMTAH